jgi:hypothetical protein
VPSSSSSSLRSSSLFVFFVVGLIAKREIGRCLRLGLAGTLNLAVMSVELLLKARLRSGSPPECTHGSSEFSIAKCRLRPPEWCLAIWRPQATLHHVRLSPFKRVKSIECESSCERLRLRGVLSPQLSTEFTGIGEQSIAQEFEVRN